MANEKNDSISEQTPQKPAAITVVYRFLGGATLGALIASIPMTTGLYSDLTSLQMGVIAFLVLACGTLASLWGNKFIDAIMGALNSFTP